MSAYDRRHQFYIRLASIILHRSADIGLKRDLADTLMMAVDDWFDDTQNQVSMDLVRIAVAEKAGVT